MFLVPANTKKSTLIMGFMRGIDAIIAGGGVLASVGFLLALSSLNITSTIWTLVACLPGIIACVLVLPIPNYHNTMVAIQSILRYYNERRNYVWRGWCIYDEFENDK